MQKTDSQRQYNKFRTIDCVIFKKIGNFLSFFFEQMNIEFIYEHGWIEFKN